MAPYKKPYQVYLTEDQVEKIRKDVLESTSVEGLLETLLRKSLQEKDFNLFEIIGQILKTLKENEGKENAKDIDEVFKDY